MTPTEDHRLAREIVRTAISDLDSYTLRGVVKSAIKELIDDQVRELGRWTLRAAGVAVIGGIVLFVLWANGWRHP